jgi:hypothetical protein
MMTPHPEQWFVDLCKQSRLRASRDEADGTAHVVGHRGDLYVYGTNRLAFCLFGQSAKLKNVVIRTHVPHLLSIVQEGDEEATFTFAPEHLEQVARICRCRFRRVLSPEHRAALAASNVATRFKPAPAPPPPQA